MKKKKHHKKSISRKLRDEANIFFSRYENNRCCAKRRNHSTEWFLLFFFGVLKRLSPATPHSLSPLLLTGSQACGFVFGSLRESTLRVGYCLFFCEIFVGCYDEDIS